MYRTYDELMERYALLMAALSMPYVTEATRISGTVELARLQNEMEVELVSIMVEVTG